MLMTWHANIINYDLNVINNLLLLLIHFISECNFKHGRRRLGVAHDDGDCLTRHADHFTIMARTMDQHGKSWCWSDCSRLRLSNFLEYVCFVCFVCRD